MTIIDIFASIAEMETKRQRKKKLTIRSIVLLVMNSLYLIYLLHYYASIVITDVNKSKFTPLCNTFISSSFSG
jgi:hypothetical protein